MQSTNRSYRRPAKRSRSGVTSRRGATTVEFALIVPIIFTMFLGAIEMTRLNFLRHTAANAAYEAARTAIIPGGTETDARNKALALLSAVGASNNVTIAYESTSSFVNVTITIPVNKNSWGIGRFSSGMNLIRSCKLSREML